MYLVQSLNVPCCIKLSTFRSRCSSGDPLVISPNEPVGCSIESGLTKCTQVDLNFSNILENDPARFSDISLIENSNDYELRISDQVDCSTDYQGLSSTISISSSLNK